MQVSLKVRDRVLAHPNSQGESCDGNSGKGSGTLRSPADGSTLRSCRPRLTRQRNIRPWSPGREQPL